VQINFKTDGALVPAIMLTGGASFFCTFAFLYTFLGGGVAGIVAGLVGIGTQLFAYALPLHGLKMFGQRRFFAGTMVIICGMVPALFSILASVGTLQAAAENSKNTVLTAQEQQERQSRTLAQLDRQIDTYTQNAEQGVESDFRTQARKNLNDSQWLLQQKLALIPPLPTPSIDTGRLEALLTTITRAAPSLGNVEQLQRALVVALAVFFDLLPVVGVALLGQEQLPTGAEPTTNVLPEMGWYESTKKAIDDGKINLSIRGVKDFAGKGEPKAKQFIEWFKEQEAAA